MINWDSEIRVDWDNALAKYNTYLLKNPEIASRDARVTIMNASIIAKMDVNDFYDFLHEEFFVWKYTQRNRLATTRKNLERMDRNSLDDIKKQLVSSALSDDQLLKAALKIKGLGAAGATALLSIMYPDRFGTIDQFVVMCLQAAHSLSTDTVIMSTRPGAIRQEQALYINNKLKDKANSLNSTFGTHTWLPRTIDKAVWADR